MTELKLRENLRQHSIGDELGSAVRPDTPREFYGVSTESEGERLKLMSAIADEVSLGLVDKALSDLGFDRVVDAPVLVDVGCGDSVSFGVRLRELSMNYIPVDVRPESVEAQEEAGAAAVLASADDLRGVESNGVNIINSRFTFAWLSDDSGKDQRTRALAEMLRIAKDDLAMHITDYDWSVIEGPVEFVGCIRNLMSKMGFETDYGSRMRADLDPRLGLLVDVEQGVRSGDVQIRESRSRVYSGCIGGALEIVESTVRAMASQMRGIGMDREADEAVDAFAGLCEYARDNPEEVVALPEIVSVQYIIRNKESLLLETARRYHSAYAARRADELLANREFVEGFDYVIPRQDVAGLEHIVEAKSAELVLAARRIQTDAYLEDHIITTEAVEGQGRAGRATLSEDVDPAELVERSRYVVALDDNEVKSVVRAIMPNSAGLESLPTIERIMKHAPEAWSELRNHPLMASKNVVEISALGKNMRQGKLVDVVKTVLLLADTVRRDGCEYAVMGLQGRKVRLIEALFGEESFEKLASGDATHSISLPGVSHEVNFVPLIVEAQSFLEGVHWNAIRKCEMSPENALFQEIRQITADLISSR